MPAVLRYGNWNSCPEPEVHCALHRIDLPCTAQVKSNLARERPLCPAPKPREAPALLDSITAVKPVKTIKKARPTRLFGFPGGTVEDIAEYASSVFSDEDLVDRTSIVLKTDQLKLPQLRVKASTAEQVFQLYNRLSERLPDWGERFAPPKKRVRSTSRRCSPASCGG